MRVSSVSIRISTSAAAVILVMLRSGLLYARKRQADRHRIGIKLNYGGVTINVYGAEGQSIQDLADEIEERINFGVARKTAAWT